MPTLHPQASFEPVPPDLDLHALVDNTPNFEWVVRISAAQIRNIGPHEFEKLVRIRVIQGGKPLVIEKWNDRLSPALFSAEWLEKTYDKKQENARDLVHNTDIPMTTGHYLRSMKQLTNQWTATNFRDERRQRLYLKDIDCPPEWHDRLQRIIPSNLFYLNENVDRKGGDQGEDDAFTDNTVAPAGDLMSSLPEAMRAQNLMCYIGHEGTYTPAHREMCASLGQNIMVEASGDGGGEKSGSSIWFMTESKDREVVREYFLSMLGHDIEIEKHFAQINAWKKAHFPVYIVEQRVGDFILIPPLAPHQVWNRGTRTMKVAWNRTTVETLELALSEALPKARLVCRDEQYKNKAIIYYTLRKYYRQMTEMDETAEANWLGISPDLIRNSVRMRQMAQDLKTLFVLFTAILVDEVFATKEAHVELLPFDSNITCSYCRCNIFNRFLTCKHCVRDLADGDQDTYDVCMECYAMGRSCMCIAGLSWCEQWSWSDLINDYENFRAMTIKNDGYVDFAKSPMPIEIVRRKMGKKSVAQICQEQLRRRPWKDITKPEEPEEEPEPLSEPDVREDGRLRKKKPRKRKKGDVYRCHVCCHPDYRYRLAFCSNTSCAEAYCYGVLYRAFDSMPQTVMQDEKWQCPKCQKICNCGACRRAGTTNPYTPKKTLLGHDTRSVADDRSVESLVDFRLHNLSWLKAAGEDPRNQHSRRLQKLKEVANSEKAKEDGAAEVVEIPDGEVANALELALQDPTTNGHGNQGEIVGDDGLGDDRFANGVNEHGQSSHAPPGEGAVGAPRGFDLHEAAMPFADMSSYPDPSMLGHERMIGMGYYEQDESEDRILFDPYQAPSAEVIPGEEGVPDYVKKAIRSAKRRARQLDDGDPDFEGPRLHARKRRRAEQNVSEPVANMDPALLGEQVVPMVDPPMEEDSIVPDSMQWEAENEGASGVGAAAGGDGHDEDVDEAEGHEAVGGGVYPANVPSLRHARPKTSYVEVEDKADDMDDILPVRATTVEEELQAPEPPASSGRDPLGLAADAVRARTGVGPPDDVAPAEPEAPQAPRPRGRGRPRKSEPGPAKTTPSQTQQQPQPPKRRGRRPRASLPAALADKGAEEPIEGQDDGDSVIRELEQQLARELAENDGGDAKPMTSQLHETPDAKPARRRGRPSKVHPPERPSEHPSEPASQPAVSPSFRVEIRSTPLTTGFTSMAERMAMRGKKFRIGKKRKVPETDNKVSKPAAAPAAAEPEPDIQQTETTVFGMASDLPPPERTTQRRGEPEDDDEFVPDHKSSATSSSAHTTPSSAAADTPLRPSRGSVGPTVVRLMDSDDGEEAEDDGQGGASASRSSPEGTDSESDSSDGDQDIPNRPLRGNSTMRGNTVRSKTLRGNAAQGNLARRGRPKAIRGRGRGR